jgi:dCMP deaminase
MQPVDFIYMQMAELHASLSKATRAKVGAVLVTKHGVTLTGYNGTPRGSSNVCEDTLPDGSLVTRKDVLHAETNTVLKAAKEGISCVDADMYVTLAPCLACSAMLIQAGVRKVYYRKQYRNNEGVDYLRTNGVETEQI